MKKSTKNTEKKVVAKPAYVERRTRREKEAASWIETFNPLRNLTITQAQAIFDAARRGNDVRLQWLYANIEQTDPTLMICAERRSGALIDLDWTVKPKPARRVKGFDATLAEEQVACLETAYGAAEDKNLFPAIEHLATAFFRGHAHVAPRWSLDGCALEGFELFDAWNFCRDIVSGQWLWNPTASETIDPRLLEVVPTQEIVTLVRSRHIDYPAMAIYLRSALGEKAWGQFLERYGVPPVIITMPPDIDPSKVSEYAQAAEHVAQGGTGALPNGSGVFYATEARGTNPFKEFLEHQQQLVVLMATGGMLTSLTGATGIGQGASDAHEETWRMIVRRDAGAIATVMNRVVSDAILDRCFPGKPHLASFDFETEPSPGAGEVFDLAGKAVAAGYRVTKEELESRTGYALEENGNQTDFGKQTDFFGLTSSGSLRSQDAQGFTQNKAPQSGAQLPTANCQLTTKTKALRALARSLQLDLSNAAEAVQRFFEDPTPEGAQLLAMRLPELLPEDPQSAVIFEQALAEAYGEALPHLDTVLNGECRARDPSKCATHGKHPGEGYRSHQTPSHVKKDELGKKFDPEHPKTWSEDDNLQRGQKALEKAIEGEVDVEEAMYKRGLGRIDFVIGHEGKGKAQLHGKGIKKLIQKHPDDLHALPETIAKGHIYKVRSDRTGEYDPNRIAITYGTRVAFLGKEGDHWVVTSHYSSPKEVDDIQNDPLNK